MVAYQRDGYGAKRGVVAVERSSKRTRPRAEGRGRQKKIVFYTNEATNVLKTKDSTFKKRAKRTQNEPQKGSKNHLSDHFEAEFARHESPEGGQPQGGYTSYVIPLVSQGGKAGGWLGC
jgi:hypothetical protein